MVDLGRWLALTLLVVGCGSVPATGGLTNHRGGTPATADATVDRDHDPVLLKAITTADVTACQKSGFVYEFSTDTCSKTLKVAAWTCDRPGILGAFASTGFQVAQALDDALGKASDPKDRGAGYVIAACGQSADGYVYAELVKKDATGTVLVRELEAHQ